MFNYQRSAPAFCLLAGAMSKMSSRKESAFLWLRLQKVEFLLEMLADSESGTQNSTFDSPLYTNCWRESLLLHSWYTCGSFDCPPAGMYLYKVDRLAVYLLWLGVTMAIHHVPHWEKIAETEAIFFVYRFLRKTVYQDLPCLPWKANGASARRKNDSWNESWGQKSYSHGHMSALEAAKSPLLCRGCPKSRPSPPAYNQWSWFPWLWIIFARFKNIQNMF